MKKKKSSKGIWVRLRRIADGSELWRGSVHLSQGATRDVHAREIHDFLDVLPATTLPVLVGGDMNTPVKWGEGSDGIPVASWPESKGDYLMGVLQEKGCSLSAPPREQWTTPTSRPRRTDAQGRQIDMVGTKHCISAVAHIRQDSHMFLGTCDHDAVTQSVTFRHRPHKTSNRSFKGGSGPRVVVTPPVVVGPLSQTKLEALAKQCTRPRGKRTRTRRM